MTSSKIPLSLNKGPLAVFYPAIIDHVIRPAILVVIQQSHEEDHPVTSKRALWEAFRGMTGSGVCYPVFNQWLHDSGISLERVVSVRVNGSQSQAPTGSALAAIQGMVEKHKDVT